MRSRSLRYVAAFAALSLSGAGRAQVSSQRRIDLVPGSSTSANVPPTETIRVSGVVVSSSDGKPVARVLVTSPDRRFAAMTDWEGRFSFEYRQPQSSTTAAAYGPVLMMRKPGYVDTNVPSRVPLTASGAATATMQLKITPASTITGHVTPESGEVREGQRVILRRYQSQEGLGQWMQAGFAQVDRTGDFRFPHLQAGQYTVMTSTSGVLFGAPVRNRPDRIQGLLPAYYPAGSTAAEAIPLRLGAGETTDITLRPSTATFYRVSVGIDGLSGPLLGVSLVSDIGYTLGMNQATHTVEGYLPSGSYTLRVDTSNPGLQPAANRAATGPMGNRTVWFAHLQVGSSPVVGRTIAAAPAADIRINVTRNFTNTQQQGLVYTATVAGGPARPSNPPVYVEFRPIDDANRVANPQPDIDGDTLVLHGIPEGTYHVHFNGAQGYVASAVSGSTNLLTTPLTVSSSGSATSIDVALRDDYATLLCHMAAQSSAAADVQQQPSMMLLGIPLDAPEQRVMPYGLSTAMTRPYPMRLPPGRYLLLATRPEAFQTLEYRNPEVLRGLMGKGVTVTLTAGGTTEVDVPILPDGDQ